MKDLYLLVVGSRSITDYNYIKEKLDSIITERFADYNIIVVSGGAKGVDSLAELWANNNGFETVIMKADWNKYGKSAGYIRNEEMHKFIASKEHRIVVAFWDGKSRGTAHNFDLAKKYNNEIIIQETQMDKYTDLRTLEDGTKFYVVNGDWTGYVHSINNEKYMHIDKTNKDIKLKGTEDLEIKILNKKGVLEQIAEEQNSLLATHKAWNTEIDKRGYVN